MRGRELFALAGVCLLGCSSPKQAEVPANSPKTDAPKVTVDTPKPVVMGPPTIEVVSREEDGRLLTLHLSVELNIAGSRLLQAGPLIYEIEGGTIESIKMLSDTSIDVRIMRTGAGRFKVLSLNYEPGSSQNPNAIFAKGNWSWDTGAKSASSPRVRRQASKKKKPREITVNDVWDGKKITVDKIPPP